jgi:hypothetical protein
MQRILVAFLLVLIHKQAHADWAYTRWDMTPDEVISASEGNAWRTEPGPIMRLDDYHNPWYPRDFAASEVSIGGVQMPVRFLFQKGRLLRVQFEKNCNEDESKRLEEQMRLMHGAPTPGRTLEPVYRTLVWRTERDRIEFLHARRGYCMIGYQQAVLRAEDLLNR